MMSMSDRAKVEQKLASVRARDARLKTAGAKMSRGLSKAASSKTVTTQSGRVVGKRSAA
jgi:hypothetical protein